jgi:hypothetical protein
MLYQLYQEYKVTVMRGGDTLIETS